MFQLRYFFSWSETWRLWWWNLDLREWVISVCKKKKSIRLHFVSLFLCPRHWRQVVNQLPAQRARLSPSMIIRAQPTASDHFNSAVSHLSNHSTWHPTNIIICFCHLNWVYDISLQVIQTPDRCAPLRPPASVPADPLPYCSRDKWNVDYDSTLPCP